MLPVYQLVAVSRIGKVCAREGECSDASWRPRRSSYHPQRKALLQLTALHGLVRPQRTSGEQDAPRAAERQAQHTDECYDP